MVIKNISYDQNEILKNILELYEIGCFELDPTFGKGNFYKKIPAPTFCYDLNPRFNFVIEADSRNLPNEDETINSIVFDPPFIHAHGKKSIIGNQFSSYKSQKEIQQLYNDSLKEFYRILKPGGFVIVKCQSVIESGKLVSTDCIVWNMARELGFIDVDRFFLLAKNRINNWKRQIHSRNHTSVFWVFQK